MLLLGRRDVDPAAEVGLDLDELAGVAVVDRGGDGLALGDVPDASLAVLDHLAELGELGREVDDAEGGLPAAVDVAAVDGSIVVEELEVLLLDRVVEGLHVGLGRRRPGAEEGLVEHRGRVAGNPRR